MIVKYKNLEFDLEFNPRGINFYDKMDNNYEIIKKLEIKRINTLKELNEKLSSYYKDPIESLTEEDYTSFYEEHPECLKYMDESQKLKKEILKHLKNKLKIIINEEKSKSFNDIFECDLFDYTTENNEFILFLAFLENFDYKNQNKDGVKKKIKK